MHSGMVALVADLHTHTHTPPSPYRTSSPHPSPHTSSPHPSSLQPVPIPHSRTLSLHLPLLIPSLHPPSPFMAFLSTVASASGSWVAGALMVPCPTSSFTVIDAICEVTCDELQVMLAAEGSLYVPAMYTYESSVPRFREISLDLGDLMVI